MIRTLTALFSLTAITLVAQPAQAIGVMVQPGMTKPACDYAIKQLESKHIVYTKGWTMVTPAIGKLPAFGVCHATYME